MQRALALAARGLGRTRPNPPVGAVVVRNGRVVGEGFTRPAGGPHAEIVALRRAGIRARGADLYVTLEPCAHHGRTPPCADAVAAAGVRRVVVAMTDPNPRVRGRGVRRLRAGGTRVEIGLGSEEARALAAGHCSLVRHRRPWVVLKLALSLDGRIATPRGDSKWVTGPAARALVQRWRGESDAIMVGAGTVRTDDPRLTCRLAGRPRPVRVVVAGRQPLPARARVLHDGAAPTWVFAARSGVAVRRRVRAGAAVHLVDGRGGRPALAAVFRTLGELGISRVLLEGGGELAASALRAKVVDEVALFVAPILLGGDGAPAVGALGTAALGRAVRVDDLRVERVGRDLLVRGTVKYPR